MDVGCPLQTRNGFCTFWGTFPERPCPQWCTCHFVAKSSAICNIEFSFPRNLISTISRCIPKRVKISTIRSSKVLLTKGTARYTCWVRPPRVVCVGRDLAVSCVRYWPGDGAVGGWAKNEYFPPLRVRKYSFFARHIPPHPRLEGGCARKKLVIYEGLGVLSSVQDPALMSTACWRLFLSATTTFN